MRQLFAKLWAFVLFHKDWFEKAMKEPDVNSRLVFFVHGIGTMFCIFILTVGFLFSHDREHFEHMVYALGGTGTGAAIGRYFTKKDGGDGGSGTGPTAS